MPALTCNIQFLQCSSKQAADATANAVHKQSQKLAAWTSFPLTEGRPVQSASLSVPICHLQQKPQHNLTLVLGKIRQSGRLLTSTADCIPDCIGVGKANTRRSHQGTQKLLL